MTSLAAVPDTASDTALPERKPGKEIFVGPKPPRLPAKPLAFLPNLMPTYKTDGVDGDDGLHMFSLVHQKPRVEQGWTPMKRGLHLSMLLVDRTTVGILERLGAVDWVPLPGGIKVGSAGIYCYTPDKGAAKMIRDGVADSPVSKSVAAKMEESLVALETLSLREESAEHDKDNVTDAVDAVELN